MARFCKPTTMTYFRKYQFGEQIFVNANYKPITSTPLKLLILFDRNELMLLLLTLYVAMKSLAYALVASKFVVS